MSASILWQNRGENRGWGASAMQSVEILWNGCGSAVDQRRTIEYFSDFRAAI
jgi:hypothetical protein